VRAQGGDGAIAVYICALWRNDNNKGEERARGMNASTRLMFTIAGCMLAVTALAGAAVGGVLLLKKRKERALR
jgi:hypothetical protein